MNKVVPVIGFVILSIMVLLLCGFASYEAWTLQPVGGVVMTLILLGLLFEIVRESKELRKVKSDSVFTQKNLLNFASVFFGALISYTLSVNIGLGAVVAAGLVGVIAAIVLPDYGVPIYCGAFVGMVSPVLLNHGQTAIAAAVAGIVYVLTLSAFNGFGGKLGTIAFTGCVITGLCLGSEFAHSPVPGWDVGWLIVVYSIIAAVVTFCISIYLKRGAVMASGIVGLVGGLMLPAIHPDIGGTLATMVICASFAGMSSAKRFPHIVPLAIAGLVAGLVFLYSMPLLCGAGGKLGTTAFVSVMAIRGYLNLVEKLRAKKQPA
ncbi:MAG: hypothetical protein ACETVW_03355 [Dehalococcoidia bacterium]